MKESPRARGGSMIVVAVLLVAAGMVALGNGCDGGREGERCNPFLSHNECGDGLSCQQPGTCAENYCCPTPATSSANPSCNGTGCPAGDAAADSATESGPSSGGDASDSGDR